MFKDMYLDYGDPHITHVIRVGMIKGNKYERVIGYDEDDRKYIINMKWCENRFTAANRNLNFLERIRSTAKGVKIRCHDGDVRSHVHDNNYLPADGPKIKYIQGNLMACSFFSLASALHAIGDFKMENIIRNNYEENIGEDQKSALSYLNEVMRGTKGYCDSKGVKYYVPYNMKGDQLSYLWLVNNISDELKLVRIRLSHVVTIWRRWIFDSNLKFAIPLERKWLLWCSNQDEDSMNIIDKVSHGYILSPPKAVKKYMSKKW